MSHAVPTPWFSQAASNALLQLAKEEWGRLDEKAQLCLREEFVKMDADGSGTVHFHEFHSWYNRVLGNGNADAQLLWSLFKLVDADGNGTLDIWETGTLLFYLRSPGMQHCDACGDLIVGKHAYVCPPCWRSNCQKATSGQNSVYTACIFCPGCVQSHSARGSTAGLHCHSVYGVNVELKTTPAQWTFCSELQLTCQCCGTSHSSAVGGYLADDWPHMEANPNGHGYLCEWCTAWKCRQCAVPFKSLHQPAREMWQNSCDCMPCRGKGSWSTTWHTFNQAQMQATAARQDRLHCAACVQRISSMMSHCLSASAYYTAPYAGVPIMTAPSMDAYASSTPVPVLDLYRTSTGSSASSMTTGTSRPASATSTTEHRQAPLQVGAAAATTASATTAAAAAASAATATTAAAATATAASAAAGVGGGGVDIVQVAQLGLKALHLADAAVNVVEFVGDNCSIM